MDNNKVSSITRRITIDLITGDYNPIIEWFNELWSKLQFIKTDVYHSSGGETIYYIDIDDMKSYVFFIDNTQNKLMCSSENYWSVFVNKFNIGYYEIRDATKILIEHALNISVGIPKNVPMYSSFGVGVALHNEFSEKR